MKVHAMRPFRGQEGFVRRGDVIEVSEARANDLKEQGLVVDAVGSKMQPSPRNKALGAAPANRAAQGAGPAAQGEAAAGAEEAGAGSLKSPTEEAPTGGPTGGGKSRSSSRAARRRRK